jgi:hypothetical protein
MRQVGAEIQARGASLSRSTSALSTSSGLRAEITESVSSVRDVVVLVSPWHLRQADQRNIRDYEQNAIVFLTGADDATIVSDKAARFTEGTSVVAEGDHSS